ncbi:Rrp4-like RNA-binding protein [Encephalitozoon hellem ATCC 50504]|uniref:Ribosomal RNA-processing protein 4 n=1 Tax=Encephalitozoon hellem TaxID=27973 RepID=A0A9Q9FCG8_ENCHE|nr:Rrp4-like RNA-binding protein [Encephalitozoon hellem ATCC 50504]AFM99228.1 Rrp4-like RNA-binding protein [Encephalitozoon hellem ATCC 50504]UTX44215.1 ribosomal RNA-processing protein 4 [Encephalitozoon hellem]|eukprot:XP_003888209.1 Rrp4-like RNA-binding protein [Encephalitozoon hellem ATCC 50504]
MKALLLPGEDVLESNGYIRGHGTQLKDDHIVSTYFGRVRITNKLVAIDPVSPMKYSPEVGNVVIGRVVGIHNKKWKMELNSKADVYLGLSAINLPGVAQRRKQESDEMSMRDFFDINDLVVSEVQKVNRNGTAALHTRNDRYGKLGEGLLVFVPHFLLEPLKTRFLSNGSIRAIVGCNGYIWIGRKHEDPSTFVEAARVASRVREMAFQNRYINMERLLEKELQN